MSQTKVIQVGTGGFGLSWLELLKDHDQVEVVGVVDVDEANLIEAEKVLNGTKVDYFNNHVEAFQSLKADVAVIVTPPQTHKDIAKAALEHDLHVFMEKPIAHNLEDAVSLNEFAKDYSKHVMISQNYRYRPVIQALKNAVDKQLAGPIEYVEWNFRRATKFGGWRDHYDEILIEDMSIHHFDMMRYLLGKNATTVYAKSMRPSWSWFNGNPTASISMTFEGVLINYFGSWVTSGPETSWNGDVKLYGEKGVIVLTSDRPVFIGSDGTEANLPIPEMEHSDRTYSITELIQAIKEKRTPATAIADNLNSFKIVSASLESLKTGSEVSLNKYS
ncbi:Gfo/Idh/MocA family protein [Saliterribacillus persicus]|uniref:Putative dehydrogenase n=1 Tax=Saliterribacillus persicus TaxID=930114 RepID=A0A368YAN0_9BACI|nr:Gfo/Idh/MocA family oxidoreductase [Saliterribacillus persicus]RCW77262.1 putative dehydrogenase [Saliterribacillus persicus]